MLKRLRTEQAQAKLRLGPGYHDEGYVFCRFNGQPYHPERFSREFERKQQYLHRDHRDKQIPPVPGSASRQLWSDASKA
jgi:hypothetical protein